MDWLKIEDIYLAFTRIFDGFLNFLANVFGKKEEA